MFYIAKPLKQISDNFELTKINSKSIGVLVGNVVFRPAIVTLEGVHDHGLMKDIFAAIVQNYDEFKNALRPIQK